MQARTKILSRSLAVIEMAFAAVYSGMHAARRRQKGFDVAANFPEENGGGKKGERGRERGREKEAYKPALFSKHFVCTRDFIRGTQMALWLPKAAAKQEEVAFVQRARINRCFRRMLILRAHKIRESTYLTFLMCSVQIRKRERINKIA